VIVHRLQFLSYQAKNRPRLYAHGCVVTSSRAAVLLVDDGLFTTSLLFKLQVTVIRNL